MIKESFAREDVCEEADAALDIKTMFVLAIATSIDALAIGITFAFLDVQIGQAVLLIGLITFVISAAGVKIGNIFGIKYKTKAELADSAGTFGTALSRCVYLGGISCVCKASVVN